jgi:Leucine-rich repeat (LRR) protein
MSNNPLVAVPMEIGNLALLKDLHEWEISIGCWKYFNELNASKCLISTYPPQIEKCLSLHVLNLSGNKIADIPSHIGENVYLRQLDLSSNCIQELPCTMYELRHLQVRSYNSTMTISVMLILI